MPKVRDTVTVMVSGQVPDYRHGRARSAFVRYAVTQRRIPRIVVVTALELAHGDASRLRFCEDGSVLVHNHPRG